MINVPFVIATFVGLLLPLFASVENPALGRRLFWSGLTVAVVSAFFIAYPPDVKTGMEISGLAAFMMVGTAYFTSPYLKFGGKVYAAFKTDVQADDPVAPSRRSDAADDGLLTSARKLWWLMVPAMALCVFNVAQYVVAGESPRLAAAMAAVIAVVALGLGYGDGRANLGFARRQIVQFVIVSIMTLGALPVLYVGAYALGRQMWRKAPDRSRQAKQTD